MSAPVVKTASAPSLDGLVLEEHTPNRTSDNGKSLLDTISGFIDIRDVLSSFLKELDMDTLRNAKMLRRMRILEEKGQDFACKTVESLKSLGSDGSFYNSDEARNASILSMIQDGFLNVENKSGGFGGTRKRHVVHRLALIDNAGELCHVVSQSDVIKFIFENLGEFGDDVAKFTAEELGFVMGEDHVVKVSPECPAIDAMILMENKDISAVAVVNAHGAIIGNFSISELRNIMSEHFGSLALPVGEFLALEHGTEYAGYAVTKDSGSSLPPMGSSPKPSDLGFKFAQDREMRQRSKNAPGHEVGQRLITCSPDTPLPEIMSTIVSNRLHRVYVCNDDMTPCGVITLTDLLRKLTSM